MRGSKSPVRERGRGRDRCGNDALTYQWSGAGTFASAGASTTAWTAAAQSGSIVLTVTVSDGRGGQSSATVTLQVMPGERLQAEDRLLPGQR